VPEYKGSLPVEELLAFVEGSVQSQGSGRVPADTKLRRTKRKEAGDGELKLRNGDSKLVDVEVPLSHLACLPQPPPLNGLVNQSSEQSSKLTSDLPVQISFDDHFPENEWLPRELASHLLSNEEYSGDVIERKDREFVLVQKKRKPKIAATVAVNGDAKTVGPLNGFCLGQNGTETTFGNGKEEYGYVNGFQTEDIPEAYGSALSRNCSDGSLAQSFSSGIDDLSHFVGEDGAGVGELYVDAPLCWNSAGEDCEDDDDKEDSLSSFCSTMSSAESHQRLHSPSSHKVASPDIDETDVLPQDRLSLTSKGQPDDDINTSPMQDHLADICPTSTVQRLSGLSLFCTTEHPLCRCTRLCCVVPHRHEKQQTPVVFCDSQLERTGEDNVSSIVFSFGCLLSDHLESGGLCVEAVHAEVLPDAVESKLDGIYQPWFEEQGIGDAADDDDDDDDDVSFMYSDSIPQFMSSNLQYVEPQPISIRTYDDDAHSSVDLVDHFQVRDVQSYMFTSKCLMLLCFFSCKLSIRHPAILP